MFPISYQLLMFLEITDTSMFHEHLSRALLIIYQLTGLLSFCCTSLRGILSMTRLSIMPNAEPDDEKRHFL